MTLSDLPLRPQYLSIKFGHSFHHYPYPIENYLACKIKCNLKDLISCFCCIQTSTLPSKQTAEAAGEQTSEETDLTLNLSLQAWTSSMEALKEAIEEGARCENWK